LASLTIENYIKTIYQLSSVNPTKGVATGKIAESLAVQPGTVTSMLKTLSEAELASYVPYEGVRLTEAGKMLALRVLRRHRLIELFLAKTLNLSWDEVHDEAENMEHAVSEWLIDKIDAFLEYPSSDPHGDPIPRPDGTVAAEVGVCLSTLPAGKRFRLVRVLDQSTDFLRYCTQNGLSLGNEGTIVENNAASGVVRFTFGAGDIVVSGQVAEKLIVVGD
jgi:DtxR family Mn-dependent transcriptional regulator